MGGPKEERVLSKGWSRGALWAEVRAPFLGGHSLAHP